MLDRCATEADGSTICGLEAQSANSERCHVDGVCDGEIGGPEPRLHGPNFSPSVSFLIPVLDACSTRGGAHDNADS